MDVAANYPTSGVSVTVEGLCVSFDMRYIVVYESARLTRFHASTEKAMCQYRGLDARETSVPTMEISPENKYFVAIQRQLKDGTAKLFIWDFDGNLQIRPRNVFMMGHVSPFTTFISSSRLIIANSNGNPDAATPSSGSSLNVLDVEQQLTSQNSQQSPRFELTKDLKSVAKITAMAVSRASDRVAFAYQTDSRYENMLCLLQFVPTRHKKQSLVKKVIRALSFTSQGSETSQPQPFPTQASSTALQVINTGKQQTLSQGFARTLLELQFSEDGEHLVGMFLSNRHAVLSIAIWSCSQDGIRLLSMRDVASVGGEILSRSLKVISAEPLASDSQRRVPKFIVVHVNKLAIMFQFRTLTVIQQCSILSSQDIPVVTFSVNGDWMFYANGSLVHFVPSGLNTQIAINEGAMPHAARSVDKSSPCKVFQHQVMRYVVHKVHSSSSDSRTEPSPLSHQGDTFAFEFLPNLVLPTEKSTTSFKLEDVTLLQLSRDGTHVVYCQQSFGTVSVQVGQVDVAPFVVSTNIQLQHLPQALAFSTISLPVAVGNPQKQPQAAGKVGSSMHIIWLSYLGSLKAFSTGPAPQQLADIQVPLTSIRSIQTTRDGHTIVVQGSNGALVLRLDFGETILSSTAAPFQVHVQREIANSHVTVLADDDKQLLTYFPGNNRVHVTSLESGEHLESLSFAEAPEAVYSIAKVQGTAFAIVKSRWNGPSLQIWRASGASVFSQKFIPQQSGDHKLAEQINFKANAEGIIPFAATPFKMESNQQFIGRASECFPWIQCPDGTLLDAGDLFETDWYPRWYMKKALEWQYWTTAKFFEQRPNSIYAPLATLDGKSFLEQVLATKTTSAGGKQHLESALGRVPSQLDGLKILLSLPLADFPVLPDGAPLLEIALDSGDGAVIDAVLAKYAQGRLEHNRYVRDETRSAEPKWRISILDDNEHNASGNSNLKLTKALFKLLEDQPEKAFAFLRGFELFRFENVNSDDFNLELKCPTGQDDCWLRRNTISR